MVNLETCYKGKTEEHAKVITSSIIAISVTCYWNSKMLLGVSNFAWVNQGSIYRGALIFMMKIIIATIY